jgi:hypothetical protein
MSNTSISSGSISLRFIYQGEKKLSSNEHILNISTDPNIVHTTLLNIRQTLSTCFQIPTNELTLVNEKFALINEKNLLTLKQNQVLLVFINNCNKQINKKTQII